MKKLILAILVLALTAITGTAQQAAPVPLKEPTVEERLADLEAYVNNGARVTTDKQAG